jgi:hypothetical protein
VAFLVVAVVVSAVATMRVVARGSPFAVKGMVRSMLPMWKNLSSKKERERLLKATMLIPFSGMTLKQIRALGLDCGKRLLRTARGMSVLKEQKKKSSNCGRMKALCRGKVEEAWKRCTTASDGDSRFFHGTLLQCCRQVATETGCSVSSARRLRPANIVRARKSTCLCPACENLRRNRMRLLKLNKRAGFTAKFCTAAANDGEDTKQSTVRQEWEKFGPPQIQKLKSSERICLQEIRQLERHERLSSKLSEMFEGQQSSIMAAPAGATETEVLMISDFAGGVIVSPNRGTAFDFFGPKSLSVLGTAFLSSRLKKWTYVFFVSERPIPKGWETVTGGLLQATRHVFATLKPKKGEEFRVNLWHDTASHFRNYTTPYLVLRELSQRAGTKAKRMHGAFRWFCE